MSNENHALTDSKKLDPRELAQFTGTEHWYRHGLARFVAFTDGVKYVADRAGAYWLVDREGITLYIAGSSLPFPWRRASYRALLSISQNRIR